MDVRDNQPLPPLLAHQAVFHRSEQDDSKKILNVEVAGYDINQGINYQAVLKNFKTIGFQATNVGIGCDIVKEMVIFINVLESMFNPTCSIVRRARKSL